MHFTSRTLEPQRLWQRRQYQHLLYGLTMPGWFPIATMAMFFITDILQSIFFARFINALENLLSPHIMTVHLGLNTALFRWQAIWPRQPMWRIQNWTITSHSGFCWHVLQWYDVICECFPAVRSSYSSKQCKLLITTCGKNSICDCCNLLQVARTT